MALLTFHGFDELVGGNSGATDLGGGGSGAGNFTGWNQFGGGNFQTLGGLLAGSALSSNGFASAQLGWHAASPSATNGTWIFGLRWYAETNLASPFTHVCQFLDSAGGVQCGMSVRASDAHLVFWRGSTSTILAVGTTTIIGASWYFFELSVTVGTGVSGAYTARINTNVEFTSGAANTQNTGNANFQYVQHPGGYNATWDDVYLLDTTGGAPLNTFLGIIRVETLYGTTNNTVAFTPLASTNVSQINETHSDNDTSYNFSAASAVDTFNHGALSSTPATVFAVKILAKVRTDDVSSISARTKLISGATTANGATHTNLVTSYQYIEDVYTTDPNTAAAWTGANVNAAKMGYERI